MDNYAAMQEAARKRFLTYDPAIFRNKTGVSLEKDMIKVCFLGETAGISLRTGMILFSDRPADFGEAMCLYDWLCDGKPNAKASGDYAPVSSLPGVLVRGNGLIIDTASVAQKIAEKPQLYEKICVSLGGALRQAGDIAYEIPLFADLTVLLKFYFSDDEFPASLVLLWDKSILQYIRYETVYYLAGCLLRRLKQGMEGAHEGWNGLRN